MADDYPTGTEINFLWIFQAMDRSAGEEIYKPT